MNVDWAVATIGLAVLGASIAVVTLHAGKNSPDQEIWEGCQDE